MFQPIDAQYIMRSSLGSVLLFLCAASLASAATIHFVGVPTGVNDGVWYVTPYQVNIDGSPQLVTCYDVYDDVNFGDEWQANLLTVDQAAANGYFAGRLDGYKRIAWLDAQTYSNSAEQVGVQHAIWNVFGHTPETPETAGYEAAADAAAANAFSGFDFSRFRFIEQVGGVVGASGTEQAFVFELEAPAIRLGGSAEDSGPIVAAEPNTLLLWCGSAIALLVLGRRTGWTSRATG